MTTKGVAMSDGSQTQRRGAPSTLAGWATRLVWMASLASLPVSQATAQSITGVVSNELGVPVASVALTLRDGSGEIQSEALSGTDGAFELAIPRPGEYRVHAHAAGHTGTVSPLLALDAGRYEVDVEVRTVPSGRLNVEVPAERYLEWMASRMPDTRTRETVAIVGREWRDVATGRDLVEALNLAGFPKVFVRRTPQGLCATSGVSGKCMGVIPIGHGAISRLRDLTPDEIEAVIYVGPTVRSGPSAGEMRWDERFVNAEILLFLNGYFIGG